MTDYFEGLIFAGRETSVVYFTHDKQTMLYFKRVCHNEIERWPNEVQVGDSTLRRIKITRIKFWTAALERES
jgi:hypothetical protein